MKIVAKAALGALALASLATAVATPASAARMTVEVGPTAVVPVVPARDPCLRAPEFRPAFCFRRDWRDRDRFAFNRDRDWHDQMWRDRMHERERQAYLDRRYWDMTH